MFTVVHDLFNLMQLEAVRRSFFFLNVFLLRMFCLEVKKRLKLCQWLSEMFCLYH